MPSPIIIIIFSNMTTDNINIRLADNNDYPQLIALFSEFADFEGRKEQMTNSVDKMNAESDFFNCLVAEKDGKIIGYVVFFYCYFTWSGKALYMDDLYITPDYRGKGLGTRFITMLKEIAAQSGCHIMRWQVADWNERARAIYKGIGAVINEEDRNCDIIL